eukprot:1002188-Lingulodinium_polyedra.AAC.1
MPFNTDAHGLDLGRQPFAPLERQGLQHDPSIADDHLRLPGDLTTRATMHALAKIRPKLPNWSAVPPALRGPFPW